MCSTSSLVNLCASTGTVAFPSSKRSLRKTITEKLFKCTKCQKKLGQIKLGQILELHVSCDITTNLGHGTHK